MVYICVYIGPAACKEKPKENKKIFLSYGPARCWLFLYIETHVLLRPETSFYLLFFLKISQWDRVEKRERERKEEKKNVRSIDISSQQTNPSNQLFGPWQCIGPNSWVTPRMGHYCFSYLGLIRSLLTENVWV
jgi:hypothetical protein